MRVYEIRYYLIVLLTLFSLKSNSQDFNESELIRYSLLEHDGCDNKISRITDYTIQGITNDSIIEYIPDTLGNCHIPSDTNTYFLLQTLSITLPLSIDKSKRVVTDTITIRPIHKAPIRGTGFYIGPTYYQYYNCGEQCDGFQQTFRPDGNLWQKGRFKQGKLKYLKTFYPNGSIESKTKERFLNGCDVTYDRTGNLKVRLEYFLFISHSKIYDKENDKYVGKYSFGRYK